MAYDSLMVFTGNANRKLAADVVKRLHISLGRADVGRFSDGEVSCEILEHVPDPFQVGFPELGAPLVVVDLRLVQQAIGSDPHWSAKLGEQVLLVGYDLPQTTVHAGTRMWVTLYWEALQPMNQDYSVFVHLVDNRGVTIAQRDSWPGAGNDPTSDWQVGQVRRDVHPLDVPMSLLAQGPCRLQVGLYDYATGQRLPVHAQDTGAGDLVILPAELGLGEESTAALQEVRFEFEGRIALTGYAVQPIVTHPGEHLQITLRWQALKAVHEDYTVFVQLLRGSDQIWGQSDHVPQNGQAPTSSWIADQVLTETLELRIGADAPEGSYQLVAGLYESATIRRLRLPDGPDFVVLGQIDVRKK